MLSKKENFMRVMHGEVPEYLPHGFLYALMEPPVINPHRDPKVWGGKDIWGVEYVPTYETGNALIPKPGEFILDDITKWRDVIKAPDLSDVDWEQMAKHHFERMKIDREKTPVAFGMFMGYFETLMSFMGFTEGLCALYEEPEECAALFQYLSDFYCGVAEKAIDYYKPDIYMMMDDTAAWAAPFISLDMYREQLVPLYEAQSKFGRDRGLPIAFHNCGKCEIFLDEMVKFGVTEWNPAQPCNDLKAIKAKYGNSLVLSGCFTPRDRLLDPDVTNDEIIEAVKQTVDDYAPGGGFVFAGGFLGPVGDPEVKRKNELISNFLDDYGRDFYYKH